MKPCVVIPAYNEEARIGSVLNDLLNAGFDVVAVDDGSSDGTFKIMQQFSAAAVRHEINLGQGAALKTGTELAIKRGYEIIIHSDADGQHRIEDIRAIADQLINSEYDVIIGSRFLGRKSELPFKKIIVLFLAKIFSEKILQLKFSDPQSGLRAFRAGVIDKIKWEADDFAHCSEILGLIGEHKLSFKEIPIIVNYDAYSAGKLVKPKVRMGWKLLLNKILE